MTLKLTVDRKSLKGLEDEIRRHLASREIAREVERHMLNLPSIQRWLSFLNSNEFAANFGVPVSVGSLMAARFVKEIGSVRVSIGKNSVVYHAGDQDRLRQITSWDWGEGTLNAWDTYEFGILGGVRRKLIYGYHIDKNLSPEERHRSRSGLAIMKPRGSYKIHTAGSPPVYSVRSSIITSAEKFAQRIRNKIKL